MNPEDAARQLREHPNPSSPHSQSDAMTSGWRQYVHLYAPLLTSALVILYAPSVAQRLRLDVKEMMFLIAATGIPTYLIGSTVYPKDRPGPTPEQSVRFTRKSSLYRAAVIATYGRLYGTPFNVMFYIADVGLSFVADRFLGERPVGTEQRRSEFLIALLWVLGNHIVCMIVPLHVPVLGFLVGAVDRTLYRTAYVALVDDIIGVLTRPNVDTFWGKLTLVLVQAFTIVSVVYWVFSWLKRRQQAMMTGHSPDPSELGVQG